jgi:hypothetical protein
MRPFSDCFKFGLAAVRAVYDRAVVRGRNNSLVSAKSLPASAEWFSRNLHAAVKHDNIEVMEWMIGLGADVNFVDWGKAPIFFAQSRAAVDLLLRANARLDIRDGRQQTCLHFEHPFDVVLALLDAGAELNARCDEGRTLLDFCLFSDAAAVRQLVERGATLDWDRLDLQWAPDVAGVVLIARAKGWTMDTAHLRDLRRNKAGGALLEQLLAAGVVARGVDWRALIREPGGVGGVDLAAFNAVCRRELCRCERALITDAGIALASLNWPSVVMLQIAAELLEHSGEDSGDPGLRYFARACVFQVIQARWRQNESAAEEEEQKEEKV